MRAANRNSLIVWIAAIAAVGGLLFWQRSVALQLGNTTFVSGYVLIGLILFLAIYNTRKKLAMLPLGRASNWLTLHVICGLAAVAVYFLHTGTLWPMGLTERVLAGLFYLVSLSGILGFRLQAWIPGRLARRGPEVIYERIPAEVARIRGEVEDAAIRAAEASGHDTLGKYYFETLAWFFERPRFPMNHLLGGRRPEAWLRRRIDTVEPLLSADEREQLRRIEDLGAQKSVVDSQFALQSLLKGWTLVHVPLAAALLVFAAWHFILVHVYAQ